MVGEQVEDVKQFGSEISQEAYDKWMRYGVALVDIANEEVAEKIANPSKGVLPAPRP